MRQPGSWGDQLILIALAHLTLRPITVLSDNEANPEIHIDPPEFMAEELWGERVFLLITGKCITKAQPRMKQARFPQAFLDV
eukprot:6042018-Pyramimonas_sp.AAC.1